MEKVISTIPFSITPDAEDYLRSYLNEIPLQAQPILLSVKFQRDHEKPHRWVYKGPSFIFSGFDPREKPKWEYVESELFGRRIAIESTALNQLAGRVLSIRRVDAAYGLMKDTHYVLVASSDSEEADSDQAIKNVKRILSVAALTVLGGFAGVGVIWIIIGELVNFRVIKNGDRMLASALPLLAIGWVLGAIASFFFFRFIFQTRGRTKFTQEQIETKYIGLDANLNWWIFLGIPTPLTIALVMFFEHFARTVGEKTAVVFVAIMIVFIPAMYFCDRIKHRIVIWLGLLGWALTIAGGYWYFKTYGA